MARKNKNKRREFPSVEYVNPHNSSREKVSQDWDKYWEKFFANVRRTGKPSYRQRHKH